MDRSLNTLFSFVAGAVVAVAIGEVWPGGQPDLIEGFPPREIVTIEAPARCQLATPEGRKFQWEPRADGWCYTEDLR